MRKFCLRRLIPIFSIAGILLLCSACGGDETSTTSQGTPAAGSVSQRITAADGGGVALGDSVTLKVPAGALPADATVTITAQDDQGPAPTELDGAKPAGPKFKVDLGGQEPSKPVTLEIAFAPDLLPEGTPEDAVFLAYYDEAQKEWVPVGGRVDKDRHVVIVETDHLSWWNPFTWNWDAWIAVLHKTLSLRLTDFVEGVSLLTEDCKESGQNVTVDNSKGNTVIKGCITKDDAASPELRVVNLKSFYVGLAPAAGGPGYPKAMILGPGDAATFTASTSDKPPATVYADFTDAAMWRFVVGLVAEMLPGGDQMPNDGLAYIADGLAMVFSGQEVSEDLDAGDAAGAADHIYELITGDKFIETFVKLATEYGQEHGVDMMSKWTASGIKQVFKAVAAVDVIISATDFLANYVFNNHSAVAFSWPVGEGPQVSQQTPAVPTGTPERATSTPEGRVPLYFRFVGASFAQFGSTVRDGWNEVHVYVGLQNASPNVAVVNVEPASGEIVEAFLTTPAGFEYTGSTWSGTSHFPQSFAVPPGISLLIPWSFQIPANVADLGSSTLRLTSLDSASGSRASTELARVRLGEAPKFAPNAAALATHELGTPIQAGDVLITVNGLDEAVMITNNGGYDFHGIDLADWAVLIDGRGFPYPVDLLDWDCSVPPGLTRECGYLGGLNVKDHWPALGEPVLNGAALVVVVEGRYYILAL